MMRRNIHALGPCLALVGALGAVTGCAIVASATLPPDVGDSAAADTGAGDADSGTLPDSSVPRSRDAGPDADGGTDSGIDSGPAVGRCPASGADVVALYAFDGIAGAVIVPDVVGDHDGEVQNGAASGWAGPPGCGDALRLPPVSSSYVAVRDSLAWDLATGSADFWFVRLAGASTPGGLLARDAHGTSEPGHMRLAIEGDGTLLFRMQDGGTSELRVSAPTFGAWHHVGVNWGAGGLELWLDGVLAAADAEDRGIDGNRNPWVIGADMWNGVDGTFPPEAVAAISTNTGIDHVRISSVRRDFSSYAALAPVTP